MRVVRWITWISVGLAVLLVGGLAGGAWYYSDVLRRDGLQAGPPSDPTFDLPVLAAEEDSLALPAVEETLRPGVWGVEWTGGYGQVTDILESDDRRVVRRWRSFEGRPGVGERVRIDGLAFPGDPSVHRLPFREVTYTGPLGDYRAWLVEGENDTWAVFVHGRGAPLRESLRILPALAAAGHPVLVITYRNDPDGPASPDGFYRFGDSEWRDLEAALRFAREEGAEDFLLVGYSMGGGVVVNFLYESFLAGRVKGVILDAPMLDFGATVDLGARQRGIPPVLTELAKAASALRFGVSWSRWNYLREADLLAPPILLFHGEEDATVPVESSDALADRRPDLVTYLRVPGAGHGQAWNYDPEAYREAVEGFLASLDADRPTPVTSS